MGRTKILKEGWAKAPNVFYIGAMRTTDERSRRSAFPAKRSRIL